MNSFVVVVVIETAVVPRILAVILSESYCLFDSRDKIK